MFEKLGTRKGQMMRIVNGNIDEFGMGDGFDMFLMVMIMTMMVMMIITLKVTMMMILPGCIVALRSAHLVKAFKLHSAAQTKGF